MGITILNLSATWLQTEIVNKLMSANKVTEIEVSDRLINSDRRNLFE
jgi:hypothetical protein